jgi:hypothetical protein
MFFRDSGVCVAADPLCLFQLKSVASWANLGSMPDLTASDVPDGGDDASSLAALSKQKKQLEVAREVQAAREDEERQREAAERERAEQQRAAEAAREAEAAANAEAERQAELEREIERRRAEARRLRESQGGAGEINMLGQSTAMETFQRSTGMLPPE